HSCHLGSGQIKAMKFISITLCLVLSLTSAYDVQLIDNGYEGVLVGISPSLDESQAEDIISSIKKTIISSSDVLFKATRGRAYFKNVTILIPKSWTKTPIDEIALNEHFEDSNIRVDKPNIIYGSQPYTLQPGPCGEPGRYIHLTPGYLTQSIQEELWGPRNKTLVHEWAKLRWGVFDEIGYPGDRRFPLFYWTQKFTANGVEEVLGVDTCNNKDLKGKLKDVDTHGSCGFTSEGLPDDNCRFVPDEEQNATSSLMSYHYIKSVEEFCDTETNEKHGHNYEAPNKHNLMCNERSIWDIMLLHEDFADDANSPIHEPMTPNIKVIRQTEARFAMVLDYSSSMDDFQRKQKLQRTARRWILHEVSQGSFVAIVKFWGKAEKTADLTEIRDMESRQNLANLIDLNTHSYTSIGAGLSMAVNEVLKGQKNSVIILVTDGEETKKPHISDVMDTVVNSGVRVVTIAFGENADPKLESLAEKTGGKTFTVVDEDDGGMLDDAFQGSLTYQPGETLSNTKINIYEYEYKGTDTTVTEAFPVDKSIGRNLQFRLDTNDESHIKEAPILIQPNGSVITNTSFDLTIKMWVIDVELAEDGNWVWNVTLSGNANHYIRVSVTAMARNPEELPIHTKSWIDYGTTSIDGNSNPIVVYAQVQQGNNPVVGAKVRAYVTQPDTSADAIELDLIDNGAGADNIENDGVYSRYLMTTIKGRFSVKAQVWDDGSSYISGGFIASKKKNSPYQHPLSSVSRVKRSAPADPLGAQHYCCGSQMPFDPETSTPTGSFTRVVVGGSFKVDVAPPGSDSLSPGKVIDFEVDVINNNKLMLTWTATGEDLDQGIVSGYEIQLSPNRSDLADDVFNSINNNTVLLTYDESTNITELFVDAGNRIVINVTVSNGIAIDKAYYVALQARDGYNQMSGVSNRALCYLTTPVPRPEQDNGLEGWEIALIVIGCLAFVALVVGGVMFAKKRGSLEIK
ncbi:unnamed protein product, partial [Meganyctiphanes norvegica]